MALTEIPIELSSTPSIVDNGNATAITIGSDESVALGGALTVDTNTLVVDATNNRVGIGTSSAQSIVHIDQGASDAQLTLETHAAGDSKIVFSQGQTAGNWAVGYDDGGGVTENSLSFAYKADGYPSLSGQNKMILTPAGNLLVGKTSTGDYVTGIEMQPAGAILSYRTGGVASIFGRTDSGEITRFTRGNIIIGRIGSYSSDRIFIGAGDTNITFKPSHDIFYPSTSTGAARDNAIDLGDSGARFKDIYLSGGVNFSDANGGQTFSAGNAANTLSDYEVGTFTATLKGGSSGTITAGHTEYTKIGNTVHCRVAFLDINTTGYSGHLRVEGLPFPMANSQLRNVCVPAMYNIGAFTADYVVGLLESS
ncbi:hypothetical protein N9064_01180, partial [bacterium]|nr:hypothetical protein [bacterium]